MIDHDKYQMKTMRTSGIPISRIYDYFATQVGGHEKIGYSRRDTYNGQIKMRGSKSSNVEGAIDLLKMVCSMDDLMFWRHTVNLDGTLQHLF